MIISQLWSIYIFPTVILLTGVIDDVLTGKFHNVLFISFLILAIFNRLMFEDAIGLSVGVIALVCAIACFLPLVLLKVIGAGDLKMMMAFAILSTSNAVFWIFIYAMIWGAVFGVIKVLVAEKSLKPLFHRTGNSNSTKIPFTFALLMGWVQLLVLKGV